LLAGRRVAVLTGAGISTDSGIPDYRGPDSPPSNPMTIRQFTSDPVFRQRYWARNQVGWRHMDDTLPNAGHRALAALERASVVTGVITQNVDLLHTKAGSRNVVNLHGTYTRCGGMLKPDIVYFGESVPKAIVAKAYSLIDQAEALLVAGSSLTVFSGYRFVRHAAALGIPIAIVNRGPTRGDDLATVKVDGGCSELLALLASELAGAPVPTPIR